MGEAVATRLQQLEGLFKFKILEELALLQGKELLERHVLDVGFLMAVIVP